MAQTVKNAMQETWVRFLGQENPLEKGMAAHSSILAGEFHGQRSLVDCGPWICKELDTTKRLKLSLFLCKMHSQVLYFYSWISTVFVNVFLF